MKSCKLRELIIDDEGLRLSVYDDATGEPIVSGYTVVGNPTVGVGRLLTEKHGIKEWEAEYLLSNDLDRVWHQVESRVSYFAGMSEVRQAVLVNMAFNLGVNGLLKFSKMFGAIEREDYLAASVEMLHSLWARQVPNRAERLAEMMRTGEWPREG